MGGPKAEALDFQKLVFTTKEATFRNLIRRCDIAEFEIKLLNK